VEIHRIARRTWGRGAASEQLEKFWRREFGHRHAVMLVESFYENVDRDGRNAVLHFAPRPATTG